MMKLEDLVYNGEAYIVTKGNEVFLKGDWLVALPDRSMVLYDEGGEKTFFSEADFQRFPDEGWDRVELELRPIVPWSPEEEYQRLAALSDCMYDLLTGLSHRVDPQKEPDLYAELTGTIRCYEDYRSCSSSRLFQYVVGKEWCSPVKAPVASLNPCTCGVEMGANQIYADRYTFREDFSFAVRCWRCTRATDWFPTQEEAVAAWNAGEVQE